MLKPYAVRMVTESSDHYTFLIHAASPADAASKAADSIGEELAYVCDFDFDADEVKDARAAEKAFTTIVQEAADTLYPEDEEEE